MKQITAVLITVMLLVVATDTASAQPISFGAKTGLNFSNLGGDDAGQWDSRTGFALGVYLAYPVANTIFFQPELLYTMKGATDTYNFAGASYTETLKYNYLEIPLLGKVIINLENSSLRPMLYAGPSPAFKLSSKWQEKGGGENYQVEDDRLKSFDLGFVIGAGAGFNVGSHIVGAEIRYNMGLTSIDDTGNNLNVKNNVIMLMVSYQIGVLNR
jgi:hypothetical protein